MKANFHLALVATVVTLGGWVHAQDSILDGGPWEAPWNTILCNFTLPSGEYEYIRTSPPPTPGGPTRDYGYFRYTGSQPPLHLDPVAWFAPNETTPENLHPNIPAAPVVFQMDSPISQVGMVEAVPEPSVITLTVLALACGFWARHFRQSRK